MDQRKEGHWNYCYDLHMRYVEKVVTQLLEDYFEEEQQEAEEFAEAMLLMLEQQEGIFIMRRMRMMA
jgi:hypothetical protein